MVQIPTVIPASTVMSPELNIAALFDLGGRVLDARPYGHGLINDTFIISVDTGRKAILQRLNRRVFACPELIMKNLRVLANYLGAQTFAANSARELKLPELLRTRTGNDYVVDEENGFWRALGFIENTYSVDGLTDARQAAELGFALGRFHVLLHNLDPAQLHETLPGFHNTPDYFKQFQRAAALPRRTSDGSDLDYCLKFAEARQHIVPALEDAKQARRLLPRPIHGDTKINNFLFNVATHQAVSLIDLDTVQTGLLHYDIGDCLRSAANPAGESPANLNQVRFDLDICRALLKAYLQETASFFSPHDYFYLYDAMRLIPYELGLRFVTDYLQGDRYFKIKWPEQNLHRALAQFRLTAEIEKSESRIKNLIADLR